MRLGRRVGADAQHRERQQDPMTACMGMVSSRAVLRTALNLPVRVIQEEDADTEGAACSSSLREVIKRTGRK